jgi:hypothetical protein
MQTHATAYLIAAPAMIYCAGGLESIESRAGNDDWDGDRMITSRHFGVLQDE